MLTFNSNFTLGSINQASALKDHDASRCHSQAVREKEYEETVAAERSLPPRKVVQHAPSNSSIVQGIQLIGDLEHDSVKKLQEIAYYTTLKGQPFLNSREQIEIEQMHRVKYSGASKNDKACNFW